MLGGAISDDEARKLYPEGWKAPKPSSAASRSQNPEDPQKRGQSPFHPIAPGEMGTVPFFVVWNGTRVPGWDIGRKPFARRILAPISRRCTFRGGTRRQDR
jgi:hypothetical protein